ncbi:uncharacterized protein [Rutidosis leptorrhynchoides]|uniref:uncharacterized protein n=1 Tax=Rutidosis leptorrhynchoides TaxID=125765 RepID=UPI003A9A2B7E
MGKNSGGKKKNTGSQAGSRVLRSRVIGVDSKGSTERDETESESEQTSKLSKVIKENPSSHVECSGLQGNDNSVTLQVDKEFVKDDDYFCVHSANSNDGSEKIEDTYEEFPALSKVNNQKAKTSGGLHIKDVDKLDSDSNGTKLPNSYIKAVAGSQVKKKVNFRLISQEPSNSKADVVIPIDSVKEASLRYNNTLYGYFLVRRLPFPVVHNYVMNVWRKFGIEKTMMNAKGFYFFKFSSEQGMTGVMEGGPWMIRNIPIILNKWDPNFSLTKEDLSRVPVWVKLHDIPLAGFTETGLSVIASKLGKPLLLDSYTSTMCLEAWGRPNFAIAMIEVSSEIELRESLKVATPNLIDGSRTIDEIKVEYEWKPPRFSCCWIFGHKDVECPKAIIVDASTVVATNKGYKQVKNVRKPENGEDVNHRQSKVGIHVGKAKSKFVYRRKATVDNKGVNGLNNAGSSGVKEPYVMLNPFDTLNACNEDGELKISDEAMENINDVEPCLNETAKFMTAKTPEGASTPCLDELHVAIDRLSNICNSVFPTWLWTSNSSVCVKGTRIIVGWNPSIVQIMVLAVSDQALHCLVTTVADEPWVMMVDFNASLSIDESSMGSSRVTIAMREFQECVDSIQMIDVNYSGFRFTWNQRPSSNIGLLKKLDRVMANDSFIEKYIDSHVLFQPYRISDHCPAILKIHVASELKRKPFKFSNYIADDADFTNVVHDGWNIEIEGHMMFKVVKKMRLLKGHIRKLMWKKGNVHSNVLNLRKRLDEVQKELDNNPHDVDLRVSEGDVLRQYNEALLEE